MGDATGIAWTQKTWNPWQGCHKVSAGCKHCYMFSEKKRYGQEPDVVVRSSPQTFNSPKKWKDPALVFTCSWSDWFIEEADTYRDEAWEIIRATPHLTYQILTKRPERIASHLPAGWPFPNVWLGVSVEDQEAADQRIPILLSAPAAVRFLSCEPLLGPVELRRNLPAERMLRWYEPMIRKLDWVIVGGESGWRARPMDLAWARSLVDQCRSAKVACFVKQLGAHILTDSDDDRRLCGDMNLPHPFRLLLQDRKGGDPSEWPADLRVRDMPPGALSAEVG